MTDAVYEILIRGNPDGTIAGAHLVKWQSDGFDRNGAPRFSTGVPEPIDPAAVADLLGENVAAMAAQITALQAELAAIQAGVPPA
jgi:hypothetical protein